MNSVKLEQYPFCADFRFFVPNDFLCKALARIRELRRTRPRVILTVPQAPSLTVSKNNVQNLRDDADCAGIAQPRMRQDLDRVRIR